MGWHTTFVCFVTKFGKKEWRTAGATVEDERCVYIRKNSLRRRRLFLLLHEAGHVISYQRGYGKFRRLGRSAAEEHRRSEARAHLYGWALACRLGIVIDKDAWREFNWEAFVKPSR